MQSSIITIKIARKASFVENVEGGRDNPNEREERFVEVKQICLVQPRNDRKTSLMSERCFFSFSLIFI